MTHPGLISCGASDISAGITNNLKNLTCSLFLMITWYINVAHFCDVSYQWDIFLTIYILNYYNNYLEQNANSVKNKHLGPLCRRRWEEYENRDWDTAFVTVWLCVWLCVCECVMNRTESIWSLNIGAGGRSYRSISQ